MYIITNKIEKEQFYEMERLEKRFYSEVFITPAEESYAYYRKFPLSTQIAADEAKIVGFINLFPVVDRVFREIMAGTYNDSNLTADDIQSIDSDSDAPLHMFISCIVVEPAYRKQGATMALLRAAINAYREVKHRCDYIVTDNVTKDGCRFSERLGLKLVCKSEHGSWVYGAGISSEMGMVNSE